MNSQSKRTPPLPPLSKHTIRTILWGLLVLAIIVLSQYQGTSRQAAYQRQQAETIWSPGDEGNPRENAEQHFRKHGPDMGFETADDYINAARDFIDNPPPGTLTARQKDGDTVFYHAETNRFAVKSKRGAPRTFFNPDPARHGYDTNLDYFKAQTDGH